VKIQQEANKKAAKAQLTLLEGAVNTYILDVGSPPTDLTGLVTVPGDLQNPTKWAGPYLDKQDLPADPWNQPFQFEIIDQANAKFRIWSNGPDQQPGSSDDISTAL